MGDDTSFLRRAVPGGVETKLDGFSEWANGQTPQWVDVNWLGFNLKTEHTDRILDRAAGVTPFWNASNCVGIIAMLCFIPLVLLGVAVFFWYSLTTDLEPTVAHDPVNWLVIPGANELLPLAATVYILLALAIGMTVHELGHGVAARIADLPVGEVGAYFWLGIPLGAYVRIDDEELDSRSAFTQLKILSAGVANNLWVMFVCLFLFGLFSVSAAGLLEQYYGTGMPTNATVWAISPIANILFWTWFLNLNLALSQAMPLVITDGGRVLEILYEITMSKLGFEVGEWPTRLNKGTSVAFGMLLIAGMAAPWIL